MHISIGTILLLYDIYIAVEVASNGGLVREIPPNPLNSGLGIIGSFAQIYFHVEPTLGKNLVSWSLVCLGGDAKLQPHRWGFYLQLDLGRTTGSFHQEFRTGPEMEGFLNLIYGYLWLFWGWVFPYISRIHTAYFCEDSSILGSWNVWWSLPSTCRIRAPWLGYVVNNHGDRKPPNWGYSPSKWPFYGLGVTNYLLTGMILQAGS